MSSGNEVVDEVGSPTEASLQKVQNQVTVPANLLVTMQNFALSNPRDYEQVQKDSFDELELVPELAEKAYYSIKYNLGKSNEKAVEGISIKGAMCLAGHWGNCWSDGRIMLEEKSYLIVQGIFFDIQRNITNASEVRVSKFYKPRGGQGSLLMDPTMLRNAILAGISKARRNAVLLTLPEWLKSKYFDRAKELVITPSPRTGKKVISIQERITLGKEAIIKAFKVTPDELNKYLAENLDAADDATVLLNLKSLYTLLKDEPEEINNVFGRTTESASMPQAKS